MNSSPLSEKELIKVRIREKASDNTIPCPMLRKIAEEMGVSYKKAGEAGRPQKVSLETKKTPLEVVQSSAAAGCLFIALLAVVLFLAWVGIQLLFGS